jgi:hypothetical protein
VFHVQLRQFPHVARTFNLTAEEVQRRFVGPWTRQEAIELNEYRFSPEKGRLTIYEGPHLRPDQLGLDRGWANVTKSGVDVTERVIADAIAPRSSVAGLKKEIESLCATRMLAISDVLSLADETLPGRRVSERVALAEQGVWELLHQGRLRMVSAGDPDDTLSSDLWQPILLSWESWSETEPTVLLTVPEP